jgi:3-deoxy-D-manno-octulosonate 8-phosphate phosphatase (KDO 8-P phosphatase)
LSKFKLELIVYDFDGVMTNNKVYLSQNGNETVQVNRADGLGVSEIKILGIEQIIISTETNPVVTTRANKLGINCLQGVENKKEALKIYCKKNDLDLKNVAYVGNDINDKEAMEIVGHSFCPGDAHNSIKELSNHTLKVKGGEGVVRELYEILKEGLINE